MSIENEIAGLTKSISELTAAITAYKSTAPVADAPPAGETDSQQEPETPPVVVKKKATRKKAAAKKAAPKAKSEVEAPEPEAEETELSVVMDAARNFARKNGQKGSDKIKKFLANKGVSKISELEMADRTALLSNVS